MTSQIVKRSIKTNKKKTNKSPNLFQAYSLEVPTVDHSTLEDQAGKVEREANRIRTEAQRLIQTNQVWPIT